MILEEYKSSRNPNSVLKEIRKLKFDNQEDADKFLTLWHKNSS